SLELMLVSAVLTRPYSRAEDIRIVAIVVAELELVDVERKVLVTHLVERADDAALYQRPKAFDGLRMDAAMHVLTIPVIYHAVREMAIKVVISAMFVGRDKADSVRNCLTHEGVKRSRVHSLNDTTDDVTFALNGSDHDGFAVAA